MATPPPLTVDIVRDAGRTLVRCGGEEISLVARTGGGEPMAAGPASDFAAWLALPLAMRSARPLHVRGIGSTATVRNARRLSEIWATWLPGHFHAVCVRFDETLPPSQLPCDTGEAADADLCFFSGGIDSTYTVLRRHREGRRMWLLTVHGMEYPVADPERFERFVGKTRPLASMCGGHRVFVTTNAYAIYSRHRVTARRAPIVHGFTLGGAGFLAADRFGDIVMAADCRLDQQFLSHPNASNTATTLCYDDGRTRMWPDGDDVTRSDKLSLIVTSPEALASVTFCVDKASRPENCGQCEKCLRTKVMFLVATGSVPDLFADVDVPADWLRAFPFDKQASAAFLADVLHTGERNGSLGHLPRVDRAWAALNSLRAGGIGSRLRALKTALRPAA